VKFGFAVPTAIEFAPGAIDRLGAITAGFGTRVCLVTGVHSLARGGVHERISHLLAAPVVIHRTVVGEPDTVQVDRVTREVRAAGCDVVIAVGGGSVLDTGKAIACLAAHDGDALDYLEVVGRGRPLTRPSLPLIAVPTTAGTGSEVTHNAVLADPATATKASLRHPSMAPRVALLDPLLTHSLPPEVTARTGLDALIQLIEPAVSNRVHPLITPLALDALERAAIALPRAFDTPDDGSARADMMLAAMISGIALAHCGLGAAHAFAGPLGGSYPIPHGIACAAVIPHVMAANLEVAAESGDAGSVHRHAKVGRALGSRAGEDRAAAWDGVAHMEQLCQSLAMPGLASFGVTSAAFPDLIARARRTSSMRANPAELDDARMTTILERSLAPGTPARMAM